MKYQIWVHPNRGDDYCYEFSTAKEANKALAQLKVEHPKTKFSDVKIGESVDEMIARLEKEIASKKNK